MSLPGIGWQTRLVTLSRGRTAIRQFVPCLETLEDRSLPALSVTSLPNAASATALAKLLAGNGVTITNVTFTGTTGNGTASAGTFTGGSGIVGFSKGIILSNGHAADVVGPSTNFASTDLGLPGDPDLDKLAGVSAADGHDATILTFDVVPKGPMLQFQYVFGSEEYNEFVGSPFDDVFGFFVNGKNVALVPGTNTPVSVNTVNKGMNSQYYIDNDPADFGGMPGPVQTSLNGLTKVLTAEVGVIPGQVNQIKLAIQDTGDGVFDSDVFIAANSFTAPKVPVPRGFKPFRYIYQASTATYDGNVTVVNVGNALLPGPLAIAFEQIPTKATLINAPGIVTKPDGTVLPAFNLAGVGVLDPGAPVVRVAVQFTDPPPPTFLSTFFEGYVVDIVNGASFQSLTATTT